MDTSGNIRRLVELEEALPNEKLLTESEARVLSLQSAKKRKNWMRNKPCVCGSGLKFKKCCWSKLSRIGAGFKVPDRD